AAHAEPRFTGDLDVFVEPAKANATRLLAALAEFGFGTVGLSAEDFTRPDRVAQLGYPPVRIDILTSISGVTFREAWKGRVATRLGGIDVAVLGVQELVKNKRAAGRPKDLADLALLATNMPSPAPPPDMASRRRKRRPT